MTSPSRGFCVIAGDNDIEGLEGLSAELNQSRRNVWNKPGDLSSKHYCEELIDYSIATIGSVFPANSRQQTNEYSVLWPRKVRLVAGVSD